MHKKIAATVIVLVLSVVLSGCTSGNTSAPGDSPASEQSVTTEKATTEKPIASNPGEGIIAATNMSSCSTDPGATTAEGEVTPPIDASGQVVISVSWVNAETSAVLAKGNTTLDEYVPGETVKWSISSTLDDTATDVKCVLGATILPRTADF